MKLENGNLKREKWEGGGRLLIFLRKARRLYKHAQISMKSIHIFEKKNSQVDFLKNYDGGGGGGGIFVMKVSWWESSTIFILSNYLAGAISLLSLPYARWRVNLVAVVEAFFVVLTSQFL